MLLTSQKAEIIISLAIDIIVSIKECWKLKMRGLTVKKKFFSVEAEIIALGPYDVITTSGEDSNGGFNGHEVVFGGSDLSGIENQTGAD